MIFTNGEKCIVCGKSFTEDDDIVICPHCGTPHHRECYNQLGHCANQSRHRENYEYKPSDTGSDSAEQTEQLDEPQEQQNSAYFYSPDNSGDTVICKKCGAVNDNNTAFCSECGERLENGFASAGRAASAFSTPFNQFSDSDEVIDGKSVSDISAVIGTNSKRFVDKFRKNRKVSWNWGAFIFSGYYFMFRKMYKEGAIVIAIKLAVTLFVQGAYSESISGFTNLFSSVMSAISDGKDISAVPNKLINKLMESYEALLPMVLIIAAASFVIAVICGLFADALYRKKVFSVLDRVDTNLENGGSFGINPMFSTGDELTQEQMRTIYLNKLGGISIFAPILAYLVLDIITNFVIPKL